MAEILPKADVAGVRLVLGKDYGAVSFPHGHYADELACYYELGTVAEGKVADLLVVDGDPLEDVAVLKDRANLLAIMKGGLLLKDELLGGPSPAPPS
ncbi:MAG: hypothetical protein ACRDYE_04900 [Acidimicrobiales bacterium]